LPQLGETTAGTGYDMQTLTPDIMFGHFDPRDLAPNNTVPVNAHIMHGRSYMRGPPGGNLSVVRMGLYKVTSLFAPGTWTLQSQSDPLSIPTYATPQWWTIPWDDIIPPGTYVPAIIELDPSAFGSRVFYINKLLGEDSKSPLSPDSTFPSPLGSCLSGTDRFSLYIEWEEYVDNPQSPTASCCSS